jgi:redox-sensitive bicupin YhaK (pirin superfamily)
MITVRKSEERGKADLGWLKTHHTFSFNSYYDPEYMGFRALRVINEDYVQPGKGFDTHHHAEMEIISYVFQGSIEHRDNQGNGSILKAGEVQHMTAGTGITHSEHNPSPKEVLGFLQIWIEPNQIGLKPGYENMAVSDEEKRGRLKLMVSPGGENGTLKIHQDVRIYASLLSSGEEVTHRMQAARHAWFQLIRGSLDVAGHLLRAGDGAAISDLKEVKIRSGEESEFVLMDLG